MLYDKQIKLVTKFLLYDTHTEKCMGILDTIIYDIIWVEVRCVSHTIFLLHMGKVIPALCMQLSYKQVDN